MTGVGRVHVAAATDAAYVTWTTVALMSAAQAAGGRLSAHVLAAPDVQDDDAGHVVEALTSLGAEAEVTRPDLRLLGNLPSATAPYGGGISCARMLLPDLLPGVDRVAYLDSDTLTVADLGQLRDADLGGHPVAAVANVVEPDMRPRLRGLGLDPAAYFNSGVLVMDLTLMRRRGTVDRLVGLLNDTTADYLWADQDILNLAFRDDWQVLDPRWNVQNSFRAWQHWAQAPSLGREALRRALEDPGVVHFEGPGSLKPWHRLCQHPHARAYRQLAARLPWGRPLHGPRLVGPVVRHLPPPWRSAVTRRVLAGSGGR